MGRILRPVFQETLERCLDAAHDYLTPTAKVAAPFVAYNPEPHFPVKSEPRFFHQFGGNRSRVRYRTKRFNRWSEE